MPKILDVIDGSQSATFSAVKQGERWTRKKTFTNTYYVLGDTLNDTEETIKATSGLPVLFALLRGTLCKRIVCKETNRIKHPVTGVNAGLWEVKADFDSDVDPESEQSPLAMEPRVRWTGETEDEVLERDPITGDPIETDAGEPIIITTPSARPILEVERYEAWPFNPQVILDYANKANSTPFYGAPTGTAFMLPMHSEEETIEQVKYAKVIYRIKFKLRIDESTGQLEEDTWKAKPLHQGYYFMKQQDPFNDVRTLNTDENGQPLLTNLENGTGRKLAQGADPQYKEINRVAKANFNNLNLGPF